MPGWQPLFSRARAVADQPCSVFACDSVLPLENTHSYIMHAMHDMHRLNLVGNLGCVVCPVPGPPRHGAHRPPMLSNLHASPDSPMVVLNASTAQIKFKPVKHGGKRNQRTLMQPCWRSGASMPGRHLPPPPFPALPCASAPSPRPLSTMARLLVLIACLLVASAGAGEALLTAGPVPATIVSDQALGSLGTPWQPSMLPAGSSPPPRAAPQRWGAWQADRALPAVMACLDPAHGGRGGLLCRRRRAPPHAAARARACCGAAAPPTMPLIPPAPLPFTPSPSRAQAAAGQQCPGQRPGQCLLRWRQRLGLRGRTGGLGQGVGLWSWKGWFMARAFGA